MGTLIRLHAILNIRRRENTTDFGKLEQLGTAALATATKEIRRVVKRIAVEVSVMEEEDVDGP